MITDGMTDEQLKAYYAQKSISREVQIVINPSVGAVGRMVNNFTDKQRQDVDNASKLLDSL